MSGWKRTAAALLAAVLFAVQTALPSFAQENPAQTEETEILAGELTVYTQSKGVHKADAVLFNHEEILAAPHTIASLTGAELTSGDAGELIFRRGSYVVQISPDGAAEIGLIFQETNAVYLYGKESFTLEGMRTLPVNGTDTLLLPLEQTLYLLNAQWSCEGGCVSLYNAPATLWNVVGDVWEISEAMHSPAEILGDSAGKKWGNSFKYGLLAFADEVSPKYLIPIVGDGSWGDQKLKEALLTLAEPCENLMGSLEDEARSDSSRYLSDIGGMADDLSTIGGGAASVAEKLTKSVTAWSSVKIPESISSTFSAVGFAGKMAKAIAAAGRFESWSELYVSQLKYLSTVKNEDYASYCEALNKAASSLSAEYGNFDKNLAQETMEAVFSTLGSTLFEKTPAGLVFSSYSLVHTFVEAYIPAAKTAQQAGDNASAALRLSDLSVLMKAQYAQEIVSAIQKGTLGSAQDVEQLRFLGSLMMTASAHSHDSLYSARRNLYLAGHPDADEDEIVQNAGDLISMEALGGKLVRSQTAVTRFEETSQYDGTLLLYGDFHNLYSEDAGSHREQIPPEYVQPKVSAENNGGNVVGYLGDVYYWRYGAGSFDSEGTFAYFPYQQAENELICRHADGTEDVILRAAGYGPIFVSGDRLFLQACGGGLFSVKLDGSGRADLGSCEAWAADEAAGTLLISPFGSDGGVSLLNAADLSVTPLSGEGSTFLLAQDGYCYYASADSSGSTPGAVLWRASLDGSEIVRLARAENTGDWASFHPAIEQVTVCGTEVYFSFGIYSGTAGMFQEGGIGCVDTQDMSYELCVPSGELGAEECLVSKNGDETRLSYVSYDDGTGSYIGFWDDYPYRTFHVMTKKDGDSAWTSSPGSGMLTRPGAFLCVDGEIVRWNGETQDFETLIPKEAGFSFLDVPQGSEERLTLVTNLDVVGGWIYFTVEESVSTGEAFGWRPVYRRERTTLYAMELGSSEPIALYSC